MPVLKAELTVCGLKFSVLISSSFFFFGKF